MFTVNIAVYTVYSQIYDAAVARIPIRAEPKWKVPSESDVSGLDPGHLLRHFEQWHPGLREIQIEEMHKIGAVFTGAGIIQHFFVRSEPGEVPALSAEYLARVAKRRAQEIALDRKRNTSFRIWLVGVDEDESEFRKKAQVTINYDLLIASEEPALDQKLQEHEDKIADEEARSAQEEEHEDDDQDDEEYEDDGDDEDADEDDEEYEDESAEGHFGDNDVEDDSVPLHVKKDRFKHPFVPPEDVTVLPKAVTSPVQINPEFIVELQGQGMKFARRVYGGAMRDNRIMLHRARKEMTEMVSAVQSMAKETLAAQLNFMKDMHNNMIEERRTNNERVKALEEQLVNVTTANNQQYENLQKIAQQAWLGFHEGLQWKSQAYERDAMWHRAFMDQEVRHIKGGHRTDAAGSVLGKLSPMVLGGLVALLHIKGHSKAAAFLEGIAKNLASRLEADEQDDEEDDDEEAPTVPPPFTAPNGSSTSSPWGNPFGSHVGFSNGPAVPPLVARVRMFATSLSDEQGAALRKTLPANAWGAFEAACRSITDEQAAQAITILRSAIEEDPALLLGLAGILNEDQIGEIDAILRSLDQNGAQAPRQAPPRPRPERPTPEA